MLQIDALTLGYLCSGGPFRTSAVIPVAFEPCELSLSYLTLR